MAFLKKKISTFTILSKSPIWLSWMHSHPWTVSRGDEILSKRTIVHCSKQLFIEGAAVAAWNCQFLFRVQSSFEAFLRRCIYMIKMSINYYLRNHFSRGALTNYVDIILSIIDHLPNPCWHVRRKICIALTFLVPPTSFQRSLWTLPSQTWP